MPGPLDGILSGAHAFAGAERGSRAAHIAQLVRTILKSPDGFAVTVQQLTCREPGCPPVETVIAVLGAPPQRWTLHHPLTAISDEMVTRLLTDNPDGDPHDNC